MKNIFVSMALTEEVLDSYLLRVFRGQLIRKKTCQVVFFPETNMTWPIALFKSFCTNTIVDKSKLRLYKAKVKTETGPIKRASFSNEGGNK